MPAEGAIPQFEVLLGGSAISADMARDIARIEIDRAIYLPGMATLELFDPKQTWADDTKIALGKTLVVKVQDFDGTRRSELFNGEITAIEVNINTDDDISTLFVRAYDKSHRLQRTRRAKVFEQQKDSDAMSAAISAAGVTGDVAATTEVQPHIFQDNLTDFDFVCRLARRNGMVVLPAGNKLIVKAAKNFTDTPVTLEYRKDLVEFRPVLTSASQVNKVTVRGWDPKTKAAVVGQASSSESAAEKLGWGKSSAAMAQAAFGGARDILVSDTPVHLQSDGDAIASATMADRWRRDIHGDGRAIGDPRIVPGAWVDLKKIGTRFSGKYFVTRTRHVYRSGAYYQTHFSISGLEPETAADLIVGGGVEGADAGGSARGAGVAIGVVTNINDPEKMGRVKLKFPWMDDKIESSWARLAMPMAGASRGQQFMPQVNDEVVVAFDRGDRSQPFVIGALWNGVDKPPMEYSEFAKDGKVVKYQIITGAGNLLEFDDTDSKQKVTLVTPGKRTLVLDDGGKKVSVSDSGEKNSVVIETNGMGKVTIKSGGDVTVEAGGKVTVNAKMDAAVNGLNVKVEAKGNLELSGTMVKVNAKAMLDLASSGITSVKGALVKIN